MATWRKGSCVSPSTVRAPSSSGLLFRRWTKRSRRNLLLGTCLTVLIVGTAPGCANAEVIGSPSYVAIGTFSSGSLAYPFGIAVDNSTSSSSGDLYVADFGASRVTKFNEAGVELGTITDATILAGDPSAEPFVTPMFIAVNEKNGDVYVTDNGSHSVTAFGPSGAFLFQIDNASLPSVATPNAKFDPWGVTVGTSVGADGTLYVGDWTNGVIDEFDASDGAYIRSVGYGELEDANGSLATDAAGHLYVTEQGLAVKEFSPEGTLEPFVDTNNPQSVMVDPTDGHVFVGENRESSAFQITEYPASPIEGEPALAAFGLGEMPSDSGSYGLAVNSSSSRIYASDSTAGQIVEFGEASLPKVTVSAATEIQANSVVATGEVSPSPAGGGEITSCQFEFVDASTFHYRRFADPRVVPCEQDLPLSVATRVTAPLTHLEANKEYRFRVNATNSEGRSISATQSVSTRPVPSITQVAAVNTTETSADLTASINPNGLPTTYRFEYGPTVAYGSSVPIPNGSVGAGESEQSAVAHITGLLPKTAYHFRVVAENSQGMVESGDQTFETCENGLARQQTGSASLLDCRAYELVSASDTGGYNVESDLVPGESPFADYPQAEGPSKVLYGVHDGAIPGVPGDPTNDGVDPYVATRGEHGWSTEYVGIPESVTKSNAPFSSTPTDANSQLNTFAFGGANSCSPCFEGGYTGVPLHLSDGALVQGMEGSIDPGPEAKPDGLIKQELSANGEHFIFGSTSQFEPGGNDNSGDVSIYDHNLVTGETHVVSDNPEGQPLGCLQGRGNCHAPLDGNGISELAISKTGSSILLGQKVSAGSEGELYWRLYLSRNDSPKTIELAPGASDGVRFDGMTEAGGEVFFSSPEHLTNEDTEHSGEGIYMWSETGAAEGKPLTLVSRGSTEQKGQPGDSDSCDPFGNSEREHWNVAGSEKTCGVLAIGGSGGIGSESGTVYFLSPEQLASPNQGTAGAPNLYLAVPGSLPKFVATLESSVNGPTPPLTFHPYKISFGLIAAPEFIAIDQTHGGSAGDVYVVDAQSSTVAKFSAAGALIENWATDGKLSEGPSGPFESIAGIAVGSSGDLYVLNTSSRLYEFNSEGGYLKEVHLARATLPNGIAVDSTGNIYKVNGDGSVEKFNPEGEDIGEVTSGVSATGVAADPNTGELYVDNNGESIHRYSFNPSGEVTEPGGVGCPVEPFSGCQASAAYGALAGGAGLTVDPTDGDVYISDGAKVLEINSLGQILDSKIGEGILEDSRGVAIDAGGDLFATNGSRQDIAEFGPSRLSPDRLTDNPAVIDAIGSASESQHTSDFQVTANGQYAVFTSTLPLTGYNTAGHVEVYRYDQASGEVTCVSCNPRTLEATGNASLAHDGLSVASDGRVFFNTPEALSSRDLDEREDVYEWESGTVELLSTGTSPFSADLLGITENGTNAYFFTRQSLVPQDENGELVKIYDARTDGGFFVVPPPPPCRSSDECHGAGSANPGAPSISSTAVAGSGNSLEGTKHHCKALKKNGSRRCRKTQIKPTPHTKHRRGLGRRGRR